MKFTWKMICLVAVLLAISLSVGGYAVIRRSFHSGLTSELYDAREDMRMFSLALQAVCSDSFRNSDEVSAVKGLQNFLSREDLSKERNFHVTAEDNRVLLSNQKEYFPMEYEAQPGVIEVRIMTQDRQKFVVASQKLSLYGHMLYLQRSCEITDVYDRTRAELVSYYWIMLIILAIGVLVTTVLTVYMTRPIRGISRAAMQFSKGKYDKRAETFSDDELGQLAVVFNRMADRIEEQILSLEDAAQRQKDFTASFAHELKTPLTSVIGYADTLRSRDLPRELQIEVANYIFSEGKRLESMSHALLDLFALEEKTPQFRTVSAKSLLEDTVDRCSYLLKEKDLKIELFIQDRPLKIVPELIQTLLYNLIDNARKASHDQGLIRIRATPSDGGFLFSVLDYGRGIPEEALSRLTEPFYMVNKSRSRAQGGAGLGLALCRKIAELHNSALTFSSELGKGTCVSFQLGKEYVLWENDGSGS